MRKASIDVKTRSGAYKVYRMDFQDSKHYHNWCGKMARYGHKIVGVRFDNGNPGLDNW